LFGYATTRDSRNVAVGYNIARQEIEKAHAIGYVLLPEASWAADYDGEGKPTSVASSRFVATTTVHTIPDGTGQTNTGCLRTVEVRVVAAENRETVFATMTYLVRGGI
jgi:hypothetical protein